MHTFLALTLFFTPLGELFEPLRVHGSLTLNAEYLPKGHKLQRESMVLSIEDFALLQSELEVANQAWDLRIADLKAQHEASFNQMQQQLEHQVNLVRTESAEKDVKIKDALLTASELKASNTNYKIALITTSAVASAAIVYLAVWR